MDNDRVLVACERLAGWVRRLLKVRGWEQQDVIQRTDADGNTWVSWSSLTILLNPKPQVNASRFYERTWRRMNLMLELEPGTLEVVLATEDHGLDPATVPTYHPRRAGRGTPAPSPGLSGVQKRAAERIAERAVNGTA